MALYQLPIYHSPPPSPLDGIAALAPNAKCTRCTHSAGISACIPHEGQGGGLLVLDSFPSLSESRGKRLLSGTLGERLRRAAESSGQPVAYAAALRCPPKGAGAGEAATALVPGLIACAPYLVGTLEALKPTRIIALGSAAIHALTGSMITPSTMRQGFSWLKMSHGWVPVFYCIGSAHAAKNKFLAKWLEEDFTRALTCEPLTAPPEPGETWAKLVKTESEAKRCLEEIAPARWTAVDAEWAGRPYDADFKLLCMAMTPKGEEDAWVWTAEALANPACRKLLADWLRDPKHKKIGSYFKADTVAFHAAFGVWTRGVVFDTRLARRLMDAEASGRLADMAHLVGRGGHKDELKDAMQKAVGTYKRARAKGASLFGVQLPPLALPSHGDKLMAGEEVPKYGFAFVEPELLYRYNAADTVVTALVGALLEEWLAKEPEGMQAVARKVALPASDTYARIESWGIRVDRQGLESVRAYIDAQVTQVEGRFIEYGFNPTDPDAGTFNPGSPKSLATLLYETLKLPQTRSTDKGAPSTDAEALEELAKETGHPVVADILTWRMLTKMRGTYVDGMAGHIRDDGRIHPTIHPDGARTGRTSSSDPNLQVLPSVESTDPLQAELAKMVRSCFAPPRGHVLLEVDYSQLELRVAADLSGDPAMLDIFIQAKDFHMQTARLLSKALWNIEPDEVTDTHRREAKPFVFGLLYDDDPYGLAMRVGCTKEKATQIKDAVFGCYPKLGQWIRERVAETSRTGAAWTWWDGQPARRRPLVEIANLDSPSGKSQRRSSWNTPIQGTGNEYLVASAAQVVEWTVSNGIPAKLLVTIHDSMLIEVRDDCATEVRDRVLEIMCSHKTKNGVPLAADAKVGRTWASMAKWKAGAPCPIDGCK